MPIDPSVILQSKFTPPDILKSVGEFAGAANALGTNKLIQNSNAEFMARLAAGRAVQGGVDADGRFSPTTSNRLVAQDPNAALAAPEAIAANQVQSVSQLAQSKEVLSLADQEQQLLGNFAARVLAAPPGTLTKDAVAKGAAEMFGPLIQQLPPPLRDHATQQLVEKISAVPNDDLAIRDYVRPFLVQGQPKGQQSDSVFGKDETIDTGGSIQPVSVNPQTKTVTPLGQPIQKTLSPEAATAPQPGPPTPEGAPTVTTRAAQAAAVAAGGPQVVGLSPGQQAFKQGAGTAMASYGAELNSVADEANTSLLQLQTLREALKSARTGGGQQAFTKLAKLAQAAGVPQGIVDKIAHGDLGQSQIVEKMAVLQATNQAKQALGKSPTQGEFLSFGGALPNPETDPRAFDEMLKYQEKLANYYRSKQSAFNTFTHAPSADPTNFPTFWSGEAVRQGFIKPAQVTRSGGGAGKPKKTLSEIFGR